MKKAYLVLVLILIYSVGFCGVSSRAMPSTTNPNEVDRYTQMGYNGTFFTVHVIGSGSGTLDIHSMSGYSPGDQVLIVDGVYSGGKFDSLVGITILPQTTRTYFTGGVEFRNNSAVSWGYVSWNGLSTNALDMRCYTGTNIDNVTLHHMSFSNISTSCILAHANFLYNYGDTTTYAWYKVTLDSITEYQCTQLIEGSFGSVTDNSGHPPDVFCKTTITRFVSIGTTSTSGEGTEVRGIQWKCNYRDWIVSSVTQRTASGDDGLVYGHGNGNFIRLAKIGGPGYVVRLSPSGELGTTDSINIINCGKFNSTEYGLASIQWSGDSISGHFGNVAAVNIYNNTEVNAPTNITYWCSIAIMGDKGNPGVRWQIRNNLGINITTNGKPPIVTSQGTGWTTQASDTSNNVYFSNSSLAGVDSVTALTVNSLGSFGLYIPTISTVGVIGQGIIGPVVTTDFRGNPFASPPDIGYLQYAYIPPPPSCNCITVPEGKIQFQN